MDFKIVQLNKDDYQDAIDFINLVFSMHSSPVDFPVILPTLYQPNEEKMQCHYAIKIDGRIRSLVGIYPAELVVGETILKLARIGAVSTHPSFREQSLMKILMEHCLEVIKKEEYDLVFLSGRRHRYMYYGFEKGGNKLVFNITKSNIKHCKINYNNLEIKQINEDNDLIKNFFQMYEKQPLYMKRTIDNFYSHSLHWKYSLYGIFENCEATGYLIANKSKDNISEIITINDETAIKAISNFVNQGVSEKVTVNLSPLRLNLARLMAQIFEQPEIQGVHNWQILKWEKVIAAFLTLKNSITLLEKGQVIIGINGYHNLKIGVSQTITVEKTLEMASLILEPTVALRLLFGVLPPFYVCEIPNEAKALINWCPLPLFMTQQDFA